MKLKLIIALGTLLLSASVQAKPEEVAKADVLSHYADLALAMYSDSLATAQNLHKALEQLTAEPNEENLLNARDVWKAARAPYQQTEVYRFGNAIVDDWEGKVNAWPLDEGLIDYVAGSYGEDSDENPLYTANVIANEKLVLSGEKLDVSQITKALLSDTLHEIDGVEANVATGYHAIEFLLWGQDLNGTNAGAGNRLASDFDLNNCTATNCERRVQYLLTASELLQDDLTWMVAQWGHEGDARKGLLQNEDVGISSIMTGMGSLSYGELAGERIKLGVLLHDPEEEHDCFSDNTHNSHYYDILGIQNVYVGQYKTVSGELMTGPSVSQLIAQKSADVDAELQSKIVTSIAKAQVLVDSAERDGVAYDQLIAEGNSAGNQQVLAVVNALLEQTKAIESAVATLGLSNIEFEGSDALDSPQAVFE